MAIQLDQPMEKVHDCERSIRRIATPTWIFVLFFQITFYLLFFSFEDGTVLCLLLNSIIEDAVPKLVSTTLD